MERAAAKAAGSFEGAASPPGSLPTARAESFPRPIQASLGFAWLGSIFGGIMRR